MKKTAIAVLVAALLGLTACSGDTEAPERQPAGEVTVSTPPDTPTASASPTEDQDDNFDTAVEFTKTVHGSDADYAAAAEFVKPESPAARCPPDAGREGRGHRWDQ